MANFDQSTLSSTSKHLSSFDRFQYSFWNKICQTFTNNKKTSSSSSINDVKINNKQNCDNKNISGRKDPCLSIKRFGALTSFNNDKHDDDDELFCCPVKITITGGNYQNLF